MKVEDAYNNWANQYDSNNNKTRDLEAVALRKMLKSIPFNTCLEIGCGTGKNTEWLVTKAVEILAIDISTEMLAKAKAKIISQLVRFQIADINQPWTFVSKKYELVTFSLVLEHIENLFAVFEKLSDTVKNSGYVYIGELHPFKQYSGTKARFETADGVQIVTCFNHHISDFTLPALQFGFEIVTVEEFFDEDDKNSIPRILGLLLRRK